MGRKLISDNDLERGKLFLKIREKYFPNTSRAKVGDALGGFAENYVRTWEAGYPIPNKALAALAKMGVDIVELLTGTPAEKLSLPPGLTPAQRKVFELVSAKQRELHEILAGALNDPSEAEESVSLGEQMIAQNKAKRRA
jgi:hypothetical protein